MKREITIILAMVFFAVTPWVCEPTFGVLCLYGAVGGDILRIDPTDANIFADIGFTGYLDGGLAYNSSDGYLYGGAAGDLLRIDPTDGSSVDLGFDGYLGGGLAYNSSDGYLYGGDGGDLLRIDPTDGSYTDIGFTGGYIGGGLACVPEPATIALLGLGALSLLRRKRRA